MDTLPTCTLKYKSKNYVNHLEQQKNSTNTRLKRVKMYIKDVQFSEWNRDNSTYYVTIYQLRSLIINRKIFSFSIIHAPSTRQGAWLDRPRRLSHCP